MARKRKCSDLHCLKNTLNVFNILFLVTGFGILAIGIWTIVDRYQYVTLLTSATYSIILYFLLAAGLLVILVAVMGCYAVLKENRILLVSYVFLLVLIFLVEAMVGFLAYVYEENVETELVINLNDTFLRGYNVQQDQTEAIDFLQENFHCCGAVSFTDWKYSVWMRNGTRNVVPDSCCKSISYECGTSNHPSNINYAGCLERMSAHMESHLFVLSVVGLGICLVQIFGVILGSFLYIQLKHRDYREDSCAVSSLLT